MTQPGPWGPPPYVPGYPPPKKSRAGWVIFAVVAVIALVAVGVAAVIVVRHEQLSADGTARTTFAEAGPMELRSIHLAAPNVTTKPGSTEPKATLTVYEDFLCPFCGRFEQVYGPTISKLISDGRIAVDYTMVSILGRDTESYSVRSGAAAYCVADADPAAFQRFHAALFAQQPEEWAQTFPSDNDLISQAKKAGAPGSVTDCVTSGKYLDMVNNAVKSSGISSTPAVLLNGTDIGDAVLLHPDPQALLDQLKTVSG
ncbi:thioredoxin domain-containing protein [Mycobacterium sp. ST-F2]|uniref:DsbA family protein n=1 Tax=Mycobacterium sp. ST-F2 TaxID=1490484 RepID=UPI000939295F|nr:thioredoxin domain-containing protein [Mycobacterium sp. ST-F2]